MSEAPAPTQQPCLVQLRHGGAVVCFHRASPSLIDPRAEIGPAPRPLPEGVGRLPSHGESRGTGGAMLVPFEAAHLLAFGVVRGSDDYAIEAGLRVAAGDQFICVTDTPAARRGDDVTEQVVSVANARHGTLVARYLAVRGVLTELRAAAETLLQAHAEGRCEMLARKVTPDAPAGGDHTPLPTTVAMSEPSLDLWSDDLRPGLARFRADCLARGALVEGVPSPIYTDVRISRADVEGLAASAPPIEAGPRKGTAFALANLDAVLRHLNREQTPVTRYSVSRQLARVSDPTLTPPLHHKLSDSFYRLLREAGLDTPELREKAERLE